MNESDMIGELGLKERLIPGYRNYYNKMLLFSFGESFDVFIVFEPHSMKISKPQMEIVNERLKMTFGHELPPIRSFRIRYKCIPISSNLNLVAEGDIYFLTNNVSNSNKDGNVFYFKYIQEKTKTFVIHPDSAQGSKLNYHFHLGVPGKGNVQNRYRMRMSFDPITPEKIKDASNNLQDNLNPDLFWEYHQHGKCKYKNSENIRVKKAVYDACVDFKVQKNLKFADFVKLHDYSMKYYP